MNENINTIMALELANKKHIKIPQKFAGRAIYNKKIADERIKYWKRKGSDTYCGQYTSDVFLRCGFDMRPILCGKSLWNINTSMQYENAIKAVKKGDLIEVDAETVFYLACIGRPALCLSPYDFVCEGKHYNHAAITIVQWRKKYNPDIGPIINQQGWFSLKVKPISHKYAWGKAWQDKKDEIGEIVFETKLKYFLPPLK